MEPEILTMEPQNNSRILAAELVGTLVLMLGGPGVAILLPTLGLLPEGDASRGALLVKILMIALGFGLALMIMMYVIGPISGCHINPAVTLAMLLARKVNMTHAVFAWIGQVVGAVSGAAIIYGIASGQDGYERGQFAANLWSGPYFGLGSTIVVEVLLTALLVTVYLFTMTKGLAIGMGGLVAGMTLTLIHLISIPVDNTSVNPARSLATALFADTDTGALQQLWAFILFPMIGAVVGVVVWLMLDEATLEETDLVELPGASELRNVLGEISHGIDDLGD
ncbi:MAG TPA: aquaporin [Ilumatobacteraceae bacterium]|nr:aquaporin [Ilumatobacteraceae bacterium]